MGKGKQYHLPNIIKADGKNIKWGKGEGDGRKSRLKKEMGMGKNIKSLGTSYTPGNLISHNKHLHTASYKFYLKCCCSSAFLYLDRTYKP